MEDGPMSSNSNLQSRYDAIIVGARCAGASTAMLLARSGATVLLIDRQAYGSDRISTHAIMRGGVLQLHRWGLLPKITGSGTPPVRNTTFHYGKEEIRIAIKSEHEVDYLCAPRRTVLDRILVDAAKEAGVEVRHGISLRRLQTASDGRVTGAQLQDQVGEPMTVQAGIVIGADGRHSTVAGLVDAQIYARARHSTATVYGYFSGLENDGFHWFYQRGVAAGLIPTNARQHCVLVNVPQEAFASTFRENIDTGFRRMLAANSPGLCANVKKAKLVDRLHGFAGMPGFLRQSHGPGWALVGDAGYFKDPLTAHGITDALRDAEILSRAVLQGNERALALYQEERDALSRALFDVTDSIASFHWDMNGIKALHKRLNDTMKTEVQHMALFAPKTPMAA
jgi:flavin-dependent dehydrogenase